VAVKLLPDGIFSRFVSDQLTVGYHVSVMTPAGRFGPRPVDDDLPHTYVAVVAGSGITPVMSIITTVLESQPNAAVVLLYGNRTAASVMFAQEIADLKDRFLTRLQVIHALSQEGNGSPRLGGRIDRNTLESLLALHPAESVHEWFLCGPAGLVDLARNVLADHGVPRRQVHSELFWVGASVPAPRSIANPGRHTVTARLDGRTTTFTMPPTGSILDAVLAHRPRLPTPAGRGLRHLPHPCLGGRGGDGWELRAGSAGP